MMGLNHGFKYFSDEEFQMHLMKRVNQFVVDGCNLGYSSDR